MRLAAAGFDVDIAAEPAAVEAAAEALAALAPSLARDVALAAAPGGAEPLFVSEPGQAAAEAARAFGGMVDGAAIGAATADWLLARGLHAAGGGAVIRVAQDHSMAWIGPVSRAVEGLERPPVSIDLVRDLGGAGKRGLAMAGRRAGEVPAPGGLADIVVVLAASALRARIAARAIAGAITAGPQADPGPIPAERIFEALSAGARLAQRHRAGRLIEAAVLTAKGRGRAIGPVKPDALVRFGVSEWR